MKEYELLRKNGQLFTDEQYKKCFTLIILALVFSGIINITGLIIAMASNISSVVIAGILIGIFGFICLIISLALKNSGKIQLYRHYKKYPKDFEREITNELNH